MAAAGGASDPIVLDSDGSAAGSPRRVADAEGESSDGNFSSAPPSPTLPARPRVAAPPVGTGHEFSGTVAAYAGQPLCAACGQPLRPVWCGKRQELVVRDAVLIKFELFHELCARTRRVG